MALFQSENFIRQSNNALSSLLFVLSTKQCNTNLKLNNLVTYFQFRNLISDSVKKINKITLNRAYLFHAVHPQSLRVCPILSLIVQNSVHVQSHPQQVKIAGFSDKHGYIPRNLLKSQEQLKFADNLTNFALWDVDFISEIDYLPSRKPARSKFFNYWWIYLTKQSKKQRNQRN